MASLYPVVPRSPSSRIPTLRTSKHFRKNSSQLELLKFNLQRKIFIERENKLCERVYSAGDAEGLYYGNKRHSLPPIRDVASVGGLAQRRRRTIGDSARSHRYGAGPAKLSPIKIPNKVPDRTSNRRYSREASGPVEPEVINGQYKPARQVLADQRRAEGQAKRDAVQHKEQIRKERQEALDEWDREKKKAVEQDVNEGLRSFYN